MNLQETENQIKIILNKYNNFQAKNVPITKILSCMSGNSGLTKKEIYKKIMIKSKRYKVLSSSTDKKTQLGNIPSCTINGKELKVFENKEGILVIRNGKAGFTFFLDKGNYTINDHAYILYLNPDCKYKISLRWLVIQYHHIFLEYSSSPDNGTWNKTGFFKKAIIDVPDYSEQINLVNKYEKLENMRNNLYKIYEKIQEVKDLTLTQNYNIFQAKNVPITKILSCMSGNSGLTEEFIYSQMQNKFKKKYQILTGSLDYSNKQFIGRCISPTNSNKLIRVVEDKPVIHIIRKGKAGRVNCLAIGNYTVNDDTYILYLRDDAKYKINLRWLMYQLRLSFLEYSSSSDNGTWNKTGFFENVIVDVPSHKEQIKTVNCYEKLEFLEDRLKIMISHANELLVS